MTPASVLVTTAIHIGMLRREFGSETDRYIFFRFSLDTSHQMHFVFCERFGGHSTLADCRYVSSHLGPALDRGG